jgi:acetate kinase
MRALLASTDAAARLAVELYCYRARKYVGAYLAVLGGADAILFGGGVGENAPAIREKILGGMQWAHLSLDTHANRNAIGMETRISRIGDAVGNGCVEIWVIPVDEAVILAEEAQAVLSTPKPKDGI